MASQITPQSTSVKLDVRPERRPAETHEDRVGSVSAGLHQPPQTGAAGPARAGAKRRESPAAHGPMIPG